MKYSIFKTDLFNEKFQDLIVYIRDEFSLKEATNYLDYFDEQMNKLAEFPEIGMIPRTATIARQGYRVLISKKNLIFYKIDSINKNIILYTIVSSKQDYKNLF